MWTSVGYNTAKKHAVCAHWRACMRERARARERERERERARARASESARAREREGAREGGREREREREGGERERARKSLLGTHNGVLRLSTFVRYRYTVSPVYSITPTHRAPSRPHPAARRGLALRLNRGRGSGLARVQRRRHEEGLARGLHERRELRHALV